MALPSQSNRHGGPDQRTPNPVVRRSWQLKATSSGPVLTGLFGFPWRGPVLQAKCTRTDQAGPAELFGKIRVDRSHEAVPSHGCSCGIYATDQPQSGWLQRQYLRNRVIVSGFVRLSGKLVLAGPVYRAQQAEIVGPLTISLPGPGAIRRLGGRVGVGQAVQRVVEEDNHYGVRYASGRTGVPTGEWLKQTGEALNRRYHVAVVGLVPPILVLGG